MSNPNTTSENKNTQDTDSQLMNTEGKNYYQEFEDNKKENKSIYEKVKQTLLIKQSMRKKENILPIVEKIESNQPLDGQERA